VSVVGVPQRMVVPIVDFDATYYGERVMVCVGAGQYYAPDHEIVRRFPDRFGPEDAAAVFDHERVSEARSKRTTSSKPTPTRVRTPSRPARTPTKPASGRRHSGSWIKVVEPAIRSRSAPPAPARPATTTPSWRLPARPPQLKAEPQTDVRRRVTPSPVTVAIPKPVRDVIAAEGERWAHLADFETGGALVGPVTHSWHKRLRVIAANGPGDDAEHRRNRMDMGALTYIDLEHEWRDAEFPVKELGCWHTHPGTDDGTPSETDLTTWASGLRYVNQRYGGGMYLGVIATMGKNGWWKPNLHAWVLRRDGERVVCEPATISGGAL
jgi:hypothetical protein